MRLLLSTAIAWSKLRPALCVYGHLDAELLHACICTMISQAKSTQQHENKVHIDVVIVSVYMLLCFRPSDLQARPRKWPSAQLCEDGAERECSIVHPAI